MFIGYVIFLVSPKKFITFDEVVAQRRCEARRSLIIQVNSKSSFSELYAYCSKYADIKGVHHYRNSSGEVCFVNYFFIALYKSVQICPFAKIL